MTASRIWIALVTFVLFLGVCAYAATYSHSYQACTAAHTYDSPQQKLEYTKNFVPVHGGSIVDCEAFFANVNGSAITAVATVFLAIVTGGLVWLGIIQLLTTRTQLRAQVFPKNFVQWWAENTPIPGQYSWRFRPQWENTGSTAAQDVQIYLTCDIRNSALPEDFDFDQVLDRQKSVSGLLPPSTNLGGGIAPDFFQSPISPQDILDSQTGAKFIYLYGKVRYFDVFPGTKEHVTRFCWLILAMGNPFTFVPNDSVNTLVFNYVLHSEGNYVEDI